MTPAGRHGGGVDVEFRDSSGSWRSITQNASGNGCSILRRECGIVINSKIIANPAFFGIGLANLEVRVTASVELDYHDFNIEQPAITETFLADRKYLHVNNIREFPVHKVSPKSKYFGTARENAEIDPGGIASFDLTEKLSKQYEPATMTGTLHIDGLHVQAEVGKTVTGLSGRNIGFNVHKKVAKMKFPQIKEVQYDIQQQSTSVRLEFSQ
jgi:hypothetical protein